MTKKIYNFDVPVSGRETFSVIASSYEEALEKIRNDEYECAPEVSDIEWDFGLGQDGDEYLTKAYTTEDYVEPAND